MNDYYNIIFGFCVISFSIVLIIKAFNHKLTLKKYNIYSKKITNDINVILITDLHSYIYKNRQQQPVKIIKNQNPDIIILSGDIFDDNKSTNGVKILLSKIYGIAPIYYVTGNHEYYSQDIELYFKILRKYNVTILDNEFKKVNIKGNNLIISGISDPEKENYYKIKYNPYTFLDSIPYDKKFCILAVHRPDLIEKLCAYPIDLVLSGHTHGGQVRIPYLLNGLYSPNQGIFPPYGGGKYEVNSTYLIISRGLVVINRLPRVFNPPEIVKVKISGK